MGMHRARLAAESASQTDALTGLLNRGGLYHALDLALAHRITANESLGVMLLDLNGFKAVNDNFGHAAGDATLCEVARRLQGLRARGWVCGRLGGDEFAVICPRLESAALAEAAEYLTGVLSGVPGGTSVISASVGWAAAQPQNTADEVIAAADAMMYAVKNNHHVAKNRRNTPR